MNSSLELVKFKIGLSPETKQLTCRRCQPGVSPAPFALRRYLITIPNSNFRTVPCIKIYGNTITRLQGANHNSNDLLNGSRRFNVGDQCRQPFGTYGVIYERLICAKATGINIEIVVSDLNEMEAAHILRKRPRKTVLETFISWRTKRKSSALHHFVSCLLICDTFLTAEKQHTARKRIANDESNRSYLFLHSKHGFLYLLAKIKRFLFTKFDPSNKNRSSIITSFKNRSSESFHLKNQTIAIFVHCSDLFLRRTLSLD